MNKKEIEIFFQNLGEIWRDITAIEFLMRCAIAKKDNEMEKFPQPPYKKDKSYKIYPQSFSHLSFEMVTKKFNCRFSHIKIPKELVELRDAMAHGITAEINENSLTQLVKFKEAKESKELIVEFSLTLEPSRILQIKESLVDLRRHIIEEINNSSTNTY